MTALLIYLSVIVILSELIKGTGGLSARFFVLCLMAWPFLALVILVVPLIWGDKIKTSGITDIRKPS